MTESNDSPIKQDTFFASALVSVESNEFVICQLARILRVDVGNLIKGDRDAEVATM